MTDLSANTRARKQATLKSFYKWCVKHDHITVNPLDKMDALQRGETLPRPLDDADFEKFLSAIPKENLRDQLLFRLLRVTGMRVGEALSLSVQDLRLTPGNEMVLVKGKGNKDRMVQLFPSLKTVKLLMKYLTQTGLTYGPLFKGADAKGGGGDAITYQAINYLWRKYCKKAGIAASIHSLRHSYATELLKNNVKIEVVQRLLGHANLQTTLIYLQIDDQFVREELASKLGTGSKF